MAQRTAPKTPLDHNPDAIVAARRELGVTQAWLASQTGISPSHMSEIEAGTRNAGPHLLIKMAAALGCPRAQLERQPQVSA